MSPRVINKKVLTYGLIGILAGGTVAIGTTVQNMKTQHYSQLGSSHQGHMSGGHDPRIANANPESASRHAGHGAPSAAVNTQVKLERPVTISPDKPTPLTLTVEDSQGKAIAQFDTFQEKLMHLIMVSDDLQFFDHIHPEYKGQGRFEVAATFPQPGSYTLFSDYKPAGQAEEVSIVKVQTPGSNPPVQTLDLSKAKTFAETKVSLNTSQPTVKAGEEVRLNFDLKEAANNQPVTDLQPYLGERGHLVILKRSPSLSRTDYIHAHALEETPTGQVSFMTAFPQPGEYKLWGQFNRNGKIMIADFWVNVS